MHEINFSKRIPMILFKVLCRLWWKFYLFNNWSNDNTQSQVRYNRSFFKIRSHFRCCMIDIHQLEIVIIISNILIFYHIVIFSLKFNSATQLPGLKWEWRDHREPSNVYRWSYFVLVSAFSFTYKLNIYNKTNIIFNL